MISSQAHYRIICNDLNTPKQLSVFFFLCINNNDIFSLSKKTRWCIRDECNDSVKKCEFQLARVSERKKKEKEKKKHLIYKIW